VLVRPFAGWSWGGARGEDGGVLVMVTLFLPVLVLFITFVVDVGNWFEHKRHLQMQADAGALAGGGLFTLPCANDGIVTETRRYAGDPASGDPYNQQIGGIDQENIHVLVNSDKYWNEGGSDFSDGGQPCEARMVDVKITEANLPWFFRLGSVDAINAHARVEVRALSSHGALPVAVPEINPKAARAEFIDEETGAVLASTPLTKKGSANGLAVWDNTEAPVSVSVNTSRVGVRVVLGGGSSTTCGDEFVECYDLESSDGILFARGWSAAGSGSPPNTPIARSVTLFNGTCADPYFSSADSTCTVGVQATVDIGSLAPANAQMTARVAGTGYPLTFDATSGTWASPATIPVPPNAGPIPVELRWQAINTTIAGNTCSTTFRNNNPCQGTFGTVQRVFSASDGRSGPVKIAQIWENGSFWANSFERGTTHDLVVKIGITGNLQVASSVSDPLVKLRVTGSQNQSVDCDPDIPNLATEIELGCGPDYIVNDGTPCPDTAPALWGGAQPWNCVAIQTGGAVGQVERGMRNRILGGASTCTSPNNWSQFPNIPPDDPRIVPIFLTPFGTFTGSGNDVIPVTGFATFYVTGWFGSPCATDDPVTERGYIVGRFIKYIFTLNEGGAGEELCDFTSIGSCIAVLTE
jgi:hypothetical protein